MSQLQIRDYRNLEYTSVSNQFIDVYMAEANDAQLKVYLYLLRHSGDQAHTSVAAMADYFNYTEKDILRALSYWQGKGVLKLDYDHEDQPAGIMLCELSLPADPAPFASPAPKMASSAEENPGPYARPDYSLDELAEFKNRETTAQLIFIAESYLGKTLSSGDIRSLLFISDSLRFSFDMVDYLLQYCVDRGKKDFRYIEKVALGWAEAHITTPAMAQKEISAYSRQIHTVMNALGKTSAPTAREVEFIRTWFNVYGFSSDVILEACGRTVLATDKNRFAYADKILSSWKKAGVHHRGDIAKADADFGSRKRILASPAGAGAHRNKFNQFPQRDYDFELLEQELLSN